MEVSQITGRAGRTFNYLTWNTDQSGTTRRNISDPDVRMQVFSGGIRMDMSGVARIIAKSAPAVASVISSVNPVAGIMVNLVAQLFGADPENPDDIIQKMANDPEAALKLKQLEYQHDEILQKTATDDRMNAREREEQIVRITGKRDYVLDAIAFLVIIGYFIMCGVVAFTKMDNTDHDILYMLIGQLTGGFIMILSYFFGATNKKQ